MVVVVDQKCGNETGRDVFCREFSGVNNTSDFGRSRRKAPRTHLHEWLRNIIEACCEGWYICLELVMLLSLVLGLRSAEFLI